MTNLIVNRDAGDLICDRGSEFIKNTIKSISKLQITDGFIKSCLAIARSGRHQKIVTTGMGKAGHAARKAASTFCSLNIPATYLHPGEASHGDSGIISSGDILLVFSTSGKTREVIELIHLAKKLGVGYTIALTSHPDSTVREICDSEIDMGIIREAGYLHIAPTTSITVMLVLADMLATISAELRGVTMKEFSIHHHSGYLGEKSKYEIEKAQGKSDKSIKRNRTCQFC